MRALLLRMTDELYEKLTRYAEENGLNRSSTIRMSLLRMFREMENDKQKKRAPGAQPGAGLGRTQPTQGSVSNDKP